MTYAFIGAMRTLPFGTRECKRGGGEGVSPFKQGSWRKLMFCLQGLRSATVHRLSGKQHRGTAAGGKGVSSCSCRNSQKSSGG